MENIAHCKMYTTTFVPKDQIAQLQKFQPARTSATDTADVDKISTVQKEDPGCSRSCPADVRMRGRHF